jgi:gamma-glutamyltranspeptidase/glutathione hydrolase
MRIPAPFVFLFALLAGCAAAQPAPEAASGRQEKEAAHAARFMVAAANPRAVDAGVAVLAAGGSAVDAAVAVQMVLNVVEPQSSGIGGGAFMLHWSARERRMRAYDGREAAPLAARPDRFLDSSGKPLAFIDAVTNGRSVGVPGVLRMLELAHRRYGRLRWAELVQYGIFAAEEGFAMSPRLNRLAEGDPKLREDPAARRLYYDANGRAKAVGTIIRNPELGQTLRAIAARGADAFYFGAIADDIVDAVRGHVRPGDMTLVDLARYRAIEREPVCGEFHAHRVCGMPPPSSGGVAVLQILGLAERAGLATAGANSPEAVHALAEAGRLAYADRGRYLADPDFVPQPVAGLLAREYLDARAKLIGARSMGRAQPGTPRGALALGDALEAPLAGTSHISIVDSRGNAVSMTTTIEDQFGARLMVRGFLLNNQLTDFSFLPEENGQPVANRVEAGKRPRSSMSPTLVFDPRGRLAMVVGSPGGSAIINYTAKALVATLLWGLDVQSAVALPNFGSRNGPTEIERGTIYEALVPALTARGHEVRLIEQTSGLHGIERVRPDPTGPLPSGGWRGGADPRREGIAEGR